MWQKKIIFILLCTLSPGVIQATDLIPVKIGVSDALSFSDSTSSERYRQAFEAALYFAVGENEKHINSCGYKFQVYREYFDASDSIAPQTAGKNLSQKGVWAVLGPRRGEQFQIFSSELQKTVVVAPMAESLAIHATKPPVFTMYASTRELALAAVESAIKENYGKTFGAIVDMSCGSCREFASEFSILAKKSNFKQEFEMRTMGDEPDLKGLMNNLKRHPVDFLLVPNYSKQSGFAISQVSQIFPKIKFIGGNGWGDGQYGFLLKYPISRDVEGFCVRQGTDLEKMNKNYKVRSLDYESQELLVKPNFAAFATIYWVRQLSNDLCALRPRDKEDFYAKMSTLSEIHFKMRAAISVFKLKNSKLTFGYEINNQDL